MASGPVLLLIVLALIAFGAALGAGACFYVWYATMKEPEYRASFLKSYYQSWKEGAEDPHTCPMCGHTEPAVEREA